MKNILLMFIGTLLSALCAFAQDVTVSGTVKDVKGEPVIGAAVLIEGRASVGTVTDLDGRWSLRIPSEKGLKLVVTCVSYKSETVDVNGRAVIDIVLKEDAELLDEVVVVGYGAMRRSDLTGSVTSVRINEDDAAKSTSLDQILDGRAAGIQVLSNSGSPDSGISIRVRGLGSFTGRTEPLYVVDGIIINGESESVTSLTAGYDYYSNETTNGLSGINPQDIASMEVLKDASATAIYGSQGANGVILITTKQGRSTSPQLRFNAGVSVNHRLNKLDVMNLEDFVGYLDALGTSASTSTLKKIFKDPELRDGNGKHVMGDNLSVVPIDWQDYVMRTSISQRYYVSVSGNSKGCNYLFSAGYNHNEGILRNTSSDNLTVRLNLEKKLFRNFTVGFKSGFGYTFSNLVNAASAGGTLTGASGILRSMMRTRPYVTADPDDLEADIGDDGELMYGPNRWLKLSKNTSERYRINPSLFAQWKILPWLTLKSTFGGDFQAQSRVKTRASKLAPTDGNTIGWGHGTNVRYNLDNLVMFNKKMGRHNLQGTVGQSLSRVSTMTENVQGKNLPQELPDINDLNLSDPRYASFRYAEGSNSLLSFFARAVYNYDDRYVLTATYRFDGSSRFQGSNKWSQFPSFAFAWRIADEPWFRIPVVSNAKLRVGWGRVGNQAISNYQTLATYGSGAVGNHYASSGEETAIYPSNINNPELKWETSEQYNVGLDLSLWRGRFTLTYDMYLKDTRDLLQTKNVALSTGFETIAMNDGCIRNKGMEITVEAVPVQIAGVEWTLGGNISFNRNTIIDVGESGNSGELWITRDSKRKVSYFNGSVLQNSGNTDPINIFIEGQPMGLFYGYIMEGIVQEGETGPGFAEGETRGPGYVRYADLNGNGYIEEGDRTIIGNPLPKFTYGFNTSVSWRGLTLNAQFSGAYGFDIFNLSNTQEYDVYQPNHNVRKSAYVNAWTPENRSNKWPGLAKMSGDDAIFSTRTVEDGSYLRMSDLSLSYSVPLKSKKQKVLKGLSFGLSCANVFVLTEYTGWSPVNNSFGANVKRMGVDIASAPIPRTYSFDVKLRF